MEDIFVYVVLVSILVMMFLIINSQRTLLREVSLLRVELRKKKER